MDCIWIKLGSYGTGAYLEWANRRIMNQLCSEKKHDQVIHCHIRHSLKLFRNCALPPKLHTKKLGEILDFTQCIQWSILYSWRGTRTKTINSLVIILVLSVCVIGSCKFNRIELWV